MGRSKRFCGVAFVTFATEEQKIACLRERKESKWERIKGWLGGREKEEGRRKEESKRREEKGEEERKSEEEGERRREEGGREEEESKKKDKTKGKAKGLYF